MLAAFALAIVLPGLQNPQSPPERKSSTTGKVVPHLDFESKILGNKRHIWVYLPPDYEKETRRYPVLYMHDGQNVFDGMTSYLPNIEWRADEAAEALIKAKLIPPIIIVGVSNAQIDRANEYLPTRRNFRGTEIGGRADLYGNFLTDEVMPVVNKSYRTLTGPRNTGLCGASFGGLITLHLGLTRPDVFGKLAVVSPSVWWDDKHALKSVKELNRRPGSRVWLDMGTDEGPDSVRDAAELRDAMVEKGWREGKDLAFYIDAGAKHNETAWAGRMDAILLWLFGL